MIGVRRIALVLLSCGFMVATAHAEGQPVRLDHGIVVDLPEGWRLKQDAANTADAAGRLRAHTVCETPKCKTTQETCTFVLRREPIEGEDDETRLAELYASPLSRYARIRAVLKNTSADAIIRQALGPARIGERTWYVVETDARHNFKSGLFAETVIGGWYLGAICKTCESGEFRHRAAREMLKSVRRAD